MQNTRKNSFGLYLQLYPPLVLRIRCMKTGRRTYNLSKLLHRNDNADIPLYGQ